MQFPLWKSEKREMFFCFWQTDLLDLARLVSRKECCGVVCRCTASRQRVAAALTACHVSPERSDCFKGANISRRASDHSCNSSAAAAAEDKKGQGHGPLSALQTREKVGGAVMPGTGTGTGRRGQCVKCDWLSWQIGGCFECRIVDLA